MAFVNILLQIGSAILVKQEILKNLRVSDSLSPPPPPPSPFPKEKKVSFKKNFSSSWFPVTCYGQFAFPVSKELNVNILPVTYDYS